MKRWLPWLVPALLVAFAVWWNFGGQYWLAVHTGTDYCVGTPSRYLTVCKAYGFWSGFGSDLGEYAIVAGLLSHFVLLWRQHTCQYAWWCWRRPSYQVGDTPHMICRHHHPHERKILTVRDAVARLREAG